MCKTFGVLPNDPLVQALTPVQVEWIIWNQAAEAKQIDDAFNRGRGIGITDASNLGAIEAGIEKG